MNFFLVFLILIIFLFVSPSESAIAEDEILFLPGWNNDLPSRHYSGLLAIPNSNPVRYYHYWFVESENDPENDPFIVWYNGGPGASSLLGFFTENGPFYLNDYSIKFNQTETPLLFKNDYSWSTVANVLYIESPAGVGFSYCDGGDPINSCPNWNDTFTAEDNFIVLQQFFKYYSEYMDHEFYITGESYAGVYIPTLVMQIQNHNNEGLPKLTGFAVGDGCLGLNSLGGCGLDYIYLFWKFVYQHGQISTPMYNNLINTCGTTNLIYGNYSDVPGCDAVMNASFTMLGGYNVYDIYDQCWEINDEIAPSIQNSILYNNNNHHIKFKLHAGYNGRQKLSNYNNINLGITDKYVCGGSTVANIYLNQDEVKEAIHVKNIPWTWQDGNWDKYTSDQQDERPYYQKWVNEYRILIYYGDIDAAVNYIGGEQWTSGLGYNISEVWRPWTIDGNMKLGGYIQIYDTLYNFTFLTVRGAGHMVPQYRPQEALTMIYNFIWNQPFLPYNGPSGPQ